MHYQGSNNTSSSSSGPSSAGLTNLPTHLYRGDPRAQYSAAAYNQSYQTPVRDASSSGTQSYSGMNMQHQRNKFASKGAPPIAVSSGMEWTANNRPAYNSPLVLVSNSNMFNGMPQMSQFMASPMTGQADQMSQYSYVAANMHPNMGSMIPCSSMPYVMNYEMQGNKPAVWYTPDQKGVQNDTYGSIQYYPAPFVPAMDGSSLQAYTYAPIYPQMASLPVPGYQVMKTTDGYVFQDLEALTQQDPAIPHAVPAMWTNPTELTLAKCLENREGITNVYIRGFLPETTDDMLHAYAVRFGKIERCKAIVDLETGLCKGFAFVQFYSFESCENCIRGFYYLGYQASFAQKSRNSRLKDLEDRTSTNIYCTNLPIDWTEADLRRHFEPYRVVSEKISRDEKTGVSKEVGFARFESREIAELVLSEFHNVTVAENNVKLLLRFADTKAQKMLKQQSNERRAYRAGEYNYSVEVVQGNTPSPQAHLLQQTMAPAGPTNLTPNSQGSFTSPTGMGSMGSNLNWTPATSISPTFALMKDSANSVRNGSLSSRSLNALDNTPVFHRRAYASRRSLTDISGGSSKTAVPGSPDIETRSYMSSPQKENMKDSSLSPLPSRMDTMTPASIA